MRVASRPLEARRSLPRRVFENKKQCAEEPRRGQRENTTYKRKASESRKQGRENGAREARALTLNDGQARQGGERRLCLFFFFCFSVQQPGFHCPSPVICQKRQGRTEREAAQARSSSSCRLPVFFCPERQRRPGGCWDPPSLVGCFVFKVEIQRTDATSRSTRPSTGSSESLRQQRERDRHCVHGEAEDQTRREAGGAALRRCLGRLCKGKTRTACGPLGTALRERRALSLHGGACTVVQILSGGEGAPRNEALAQIKHWLPEETQK